jgi:mannose-6-phosphate isomerase-like protein (cupin superfamily)
MEPVVYMPGEGIPVGFGSSVMKATASTTGGAFSMSEATFPAHTDGPPRHTHERTVDSFYVLEGTLHLWVGDEEIDLPAGGYALVPPGVEHTFANRSDEPVRILNLNSPGWFEDYLVDLAKAIDDGIIPGGEEFARIVQKYDIKPTS